MILTFSRGLNVTGKLMLVPELRIIGCGYFVVKNRLDGILLVKRENIMNNEAAIEFQSFICLQ